MKRIAIFLGHPAHFHLFKNTAKDLSNDGFDVLFLIKRKDIVEDLVIESGYKYIVVRERERVNSTKIGLVWSLIKMDLNVARSLLKFKPMIMAGTYTPFLSRWTGVPVISCNEDDVDVVPRFAKMSYPYAKDILTPIVCDNGKWNEKSIKYASYHELAYLHPNNFTPDKQIVEKYFPADKSYFIIRFAKLNAHHDIGIKGINIDIASRLIEILKPFGQIYITSERPLESQLEPYRIKIDPIDMHHVMAFSTLYIGDSQTMAAEAAVLGVPFVRYNDFVGRIGYLNELENVYHLGFGIKASEEGSADKMYRTVEELLSLPDLKAEWQLRRQVMLSEKIDYAAFLTWFIENYPESQKIMKENPDYQWRFR
ncbi:MAG: DUF354 domain-containing protein [Bacteroidales bacterium]|nr:DUF354 domain-containing protein [Bacteroidales bacterium]